MPHKVIELIRVSTEGQAAENKAGIPAQRAVNRQTAKAYGLEIVRSIEMTDVSGAAVLRAPEMQDLLQSMASPSIHGVVTKEFSRLMRPENYADFAILQAFADTKTQLYLPDGPIDFASKTGRLLGGMRALMAGEERAVFLERSWTAKEEKRKAGKNPGSAITLPFAVGYDEQRGWFYKPEADRVKEAFRLMLAGNTSYVAVAKKLGFNHCHLRLMLRNPIYSGWRVIDKRRDPSAAALKTTANGRQADRRKIQRAPEDVIRVKVISDPLVSEQDFKRLQSMLDTKKQKHWRVNPEHVSPFAYHGFLSCSDCGELIYVYSNRRKSRAKRHYYYVCKAKQYPKQAGHKCATAYMRREELEPKLDRLFSEQLTNRGFLDGITSEYERRSAAGTDQSKLMRLQAEIEKLRSKRARVVESFIDGVLSKKQRDERLAELDRSIRANEEVMLHERPPQGLSAEELSAVFAPFYEWKFLKVDEKRQILSTLMPEIKVANCEIAGMYVIPPLRHDEVIRRDKGSWPPPA